MWVGAIQLVSSCFEAQCSLNSVSNLSSIKPLGASVNYLIHGFKITVFLSKLPWRRRQRVPPTHRYTQTNIHTRRHIPGYCNVTAVHGITHQSTQSLIIPELKGVCDTLYMPPQEQVNVTTSAVRTYNDVSFGSSLNASSATCRMLLPFRLLQRRIFCITIKLQNSSEHTGCFTTLGHNCRRWFPRSLWWKKFV